MVIERRAASRASAWLLATACGLAQAQVGMPAQPPLQGVVMLSASASTELNRDWLTISFAATREGSDAAEVQARLKQALEAALAQARRVERPGEIELRTGAFGLAPRYTNKGEANGWRGHAELIVQGRDTAGIAQLAGRITTMNVAQVQPSLSRQRRAEAEAEVTARAIAAWRSRAAATAQLFGYADHVLREVSVSSLDAPSPPPMPMRMRAAESGMEEALPVQAGQETVTVTVQGSIQLLPGR